MTLETLEEIHQAKAKVKLNPKLLEEEVDDDDDDEEDYPIRRAVALLEQSMYLLGYMGDPELAPRLNKSNRQSLLKQAENIKGFLIEIEE